MSEKITPKNNEAGKSESIPRIHWEEILNMYRRAARGDNNARNEIVLRLAQVADCEIAIMGGVSPEDERQAALVSIIESVDKRIAFEPDPSDDVQLFRNRFAGILYYGIKSAIAESRTDQEQEYTLPLNDILGYAADDGRLDKMSDLEAIRDMLGRLKEKQREILYDHYGLDGRDPKTYLEIGSKRGVSRSRVDQVAQRALAILSRDPDIDLFKD
jgi:DNA-directed RNA polymerase specialized sigma24 family protein